MSDSGRHEIGNYIRITIVVVGGFLWIWFIWQISSDQARGQIEEHYATRDYAERANNNIRNNCLPLPASEQSECIEKEIKSRRTEQRDERDLKAQETMARWTWVMGGVAGMGLAVSLVSIGLIYVTLRETRKAADSATKTHQAYIAVERSRLVLSPVGPKIYQNVGRCHIEATNIGKTDCVIYSVAAWWSNTSDWAKYDSIIASPKAIVVKASETKLAFPTIGTSAGERFVMGVVKYKSPISNDHRSYFSFEIEWNASLDREVAREFRAKGKPEDT